MRGQAWLICDPEGRIIATHEWASPQGPQHCPLNADGSYYRVPHAIYCRLVEAQEEWAQRGGQIEFRVTEHGVQFDGQVLIPLEELTTDEPL